MSEIPVGKDDALHIDERPPLLDRVPAVAPIPAKPGAPEGRTSPEGRRALVRRLQVNTSSKLAAEVVGRGLQFGLAYLAQRTLGPATYGQFTYALAAGFVAATLTDLGLQLIVTRELARDEAFVDTPQVAGAGLALKMALALLAGGLLIVFSLTRPPAAQAATFLVGLALIGQSFVEFLGYVFRGLQRVEHEAALTLLMRLTTVGLGVWALRSGWGVNEFVDLAVAYVIGAGAAAALGYAWLGRRFFKPALTFAPARWLRLLREALPLGGAIVLSVAYTRTAVFLLDALRGAEAVGLYGVAQKLTEPLAIFPAALMAAVFPAFTQGMALRNGQAGWVGRRAIGLLALVGAAIAAAGVLGGPWLIERLYGSHAPWARGSEAALQILAISALFSFINYALTHFLIALGRQTLNLLFNAILFVVNLALCLALIPRFGPAGAAWAVLVSECLLLVLCGTALSRQSSDISRQTDN